MDKGASIKKAKDNLIKFLNEFSQSSKNFSMLSIFSSIISIKFSDILKIDLKLCLLNT